MSDLERFVEWLKKCSIPYVEERGTFDTEGDYRDGYPWEPEDDDEPTDADDLDDDED